MFTPFSLCLKVKPLQLQVALFLWCWNFKLVASSVLAELNSEQRAKARAERISCILNQDKVAGKRKDGTEHTKRLLDFDIKYNKAMMLFRSLGAAHTKKNIYGETKQKQKAGSCKRYEKISVLLHTYTV